DVQLPADRYRAPGAALRLFEELDRLLEGVPGLRSATFSDGAPPGGSFAFNSRPEAEGRPAVNLDGVDVPNPTVAADYFDTLGIPLVAGRAFAKDDPDDLVIVSNGLARRVWGQES